MWPVLSIIYLSVAFLCWRGSSQGFALAISFAFLGLIADFLFILLNVLGLFNPNVVDPVLIGYALLQLPLAYAALRVYKRSLLWPILLILIGSLLISASYIQNTTSSYLAPGIDISHPQVATLSQILNGTYRSALDKYGGNGTVVEVVNVTVSQVFGALDGDWHIVVKDPKVSLFVTEVLPRDQARLHAPVIGGRIMMIGIVYWDNEHVNEDWHGYTGWEIHPVLAWSAIS